MHVKVKDAYIFASKRLDKAAPSGRQAALANDLQTTYVQALRRDVTNLLHNLGDGLATHRHVRVVDPTKRDRYLDTLDAHRQVEKGVDWFGGQHLNVDFWGNIDSTFVSRERMPEKFRPDEL